jgi:peptidoglycan/LPS O-acetylase OafA/YrhL
LTYIKQFDTVRAFAVFLVILSHWPVGLNVPFNLGSIGVTIFFVLSGFLITQILLRDKQKNDILDNNTNRLRTIWKFTMRRAIRIFPIYYILLIALLLSSSIFYNPIKQDWYYYFLYVQNYIFFLRNAFPGGKLSHMWSLAVEEQFYLFWPWLIVFINKKHLIKVLIGGLIIGITFQFAMPFIWGSRNPYAGLLTPACIDSFCAGGLLAYIIVYKNALNQYYPIIQKIGIVALILFLASSFFKIKLYFPERTIVSIITTWLLAKILTNQNKYFDYIMSNELVMSLGKVSYGIYLFHNFIPTIVFAIFHWIEKNPTKVPFSNMLIQISYNKSIFLLVCTFVLLAITYTSFNLIEKPILKLKKHFN